jgi:hypothetical protein
LEDREVDGKITTRKMEKEMGESIAWKTKKEMEGNVTWKNKKEMGE